jgi:hypothetical protein
MANDPELDVTPGKCPHGRFTELGRRLMAVPKSEVDKREKAWQKRKRPKPGTKRRG